MKFLADQNLEGPIVSRLRSEGYDVAAIDFAELVFLQKQAAAGIVRVRLPEWSSLNKGQRLVQVLEAFGDRLQGSMTVVGERATRRRPLP